MFGPKRQDWLDQLEQVYTDIQAALEWFAAHGEAKQGLRLVIGLREFWLGGGQLEAGRQWLETFLAHPQVAEPSKLRAQGLDDLASLAFWQNDAQTVRRRTLEALALRRTLEDKPGLVVSLIHAGNVERLFEKNLTAARRYYDECLVLERELDDARGIPVLKVVLGNLALDEEDYPTAKRLLRQALTALRGEEALWTINFALDSLAGVAAHQGQPKRALRLAAASAALRTALGIVHPPVVQVWLDELLKPAWQVLDQVTAAKSWAEGQAMTWEQAVVYALENLTDL